MKKTIAIFASLGLFWFAATSFVNMPQNLSGFTDTYVGSYFSGNVEVYSLKEGYQNRGHAVWMNRSAKKIRAKYFSFGDVYGKYKNWKRNKEIVLTCSGAFSDDLYKGNGALPVGLNVENGEIKNRSVLKDGMDALVIVYATGGIVVSDLTRGDLYLQSLDKKVDVRKDYSAKYELLDWAEKEKATIFQTQLLAYDNELKIDTRGRKNSRERRFLALATNSSGTLYHIIFNLPANTYLYDGAKNVLDYLKNKNMDVTAILNLDTGAYNILDFYSSDSRLNSLLDGPNRVQQAVNLLSYSYN